MKKKGLGLLLAVFICLCSVFASACGKTDDNKDNGGEKPPVSIATQENFDFGAAIKKQDKWKGVMTNNPVFDTENGFLTFREKSNNAIVYTDVGMSTGDIELKVKVRVNTDTTAYVSFSNTSSRLEGFCYEEGGKMYTVEFSSDSKMYVKKWVNGVETVLKGNKSSVSVPMSFASAFADMKISVDETNGKITVKVYTGSTLLLDVEDSDNPLLGGGAVGVSYMGAGGMAIGGKSSVVADYVAPEPLGITLYDSPNVAVAEGEINLLDNFSSVWTGRERIFNVENKDGGYVFSSKDNPQEPQAGVTEYQAIYTDKIFGNAQFEYTYNQIANGEWTMFWLRCVPQSSTNVSIWGNKQTRENTNGYSVLITNDGYVQIHKWSDFSQIWLNGQGAKLPGTVAALFNDPSKDINLKMSIEDKVVAGKRTIEIRVKVGDFSIPVVQDSDTPFVNAGYIGLQGYATANKVDSIKLTAAKATTTLTL